MACWRLPGGRRLQDREHFPRGLSRGRLVGAGCVWEWALVKARGILDVFLQEGVSLSAQFWGPCEHDRDQKGAWGSPRRLWVAWNLGMKKAS